MLMGVFANAQYTNDWINYSQDYYYFKVWQDGVYSLDYTTLQASGVPVGTISPDDFQLFAFEREQQILVEDGGDGSFDSGDRILFVGRKNTTWIDSLMYEDPSLVGNKYYPHYGDTIVYYLSWNSATANARIQPETDVNFGAFTPQPYFLETNFTEYHQTYQTGFKISGMSYSEYVDGEGWFGATFSSIVGSTYADAYVQVSQPYTLAGAPNAYGTAVSAGASNASGVQNHHMLLQYGNSNITLADTAYLGYKKIALDYQIPASDLQNGNMKFRHQGVNDLGVASDYMSISYVEMTYPRMPNAANSSYLEVSAPFNSLEAKSRYDVINFSGANPRLFTISDGMKEIPVVNNAGTLQMLIPNHSLGDEVQFILFDESQVSTVSSVVPVNGTGSFQDLSAVDFNDAYIIISGAPLWTSANAYKSYRESVNGGGYNVVLLDQEELWMQFGGGIPKHPWGIRQFAKYAYETSGVKPNHMFLIGKGIREGNESISAPLGTRQNPTSFNECIVPAYGFPCSDGLMTANLSGNGTEPLIPTGRLAAKNDQEVNWYLDKMMEYEAEQDSNSIYTVADKLWQKEILHFGGGGNEQEQYVFRQYLESYENDLEDIHYGGNVTSFYKTVSDPIDPTTLFEVTDNISDGASIMTFFGHASADGFDQNVDDPANWNNTGKYPIVVGNACLTGNIFEPTSASASEEYIIIDDLGAIAFISNVKQAFSNSLHDFSSALMGRIAYEDYGKSLGQAVQNSLAYLDNTGAQGFGKQNVMNQMTLHGDPALRPNFHNRPELEVNESSIFITPENVDLSVDSIDVNIVLYNLGKATADTFAVELTRTFPNNGGDSLYTQLIPGAYYIDTIVFTIPLYNNIGIGINEFSVSVDIPSFIDEQYDEIGNNQISKQVIFDVDGIYPVWPYEFAVVPNDTITLKGSSINPFASTATYRFEVDTTDLFNSPEHRYFEQSSLGGVIEVDYDQWLNMGTGINDPLVMEDSMVYFWRVSAVDTSYYWIESSFQYIENKVGWGQDHFFQFRDNDFLFINYDTLDRTRKFGPAFRLIDADVFGEATSWLETAFTLYHIDGEIAEYNFCTLTPQLLVSVIDPVTLEPWGTRWFNGTTMENPNNDFGNHNDNGGCRPRVEYHFSFWQNMPTEMDDFDNMIANEIPDGHYILIYTARFADFANWDQNNFNTFQSLGVDSATVAANGDSPFILFTRKGNIGDLNMDVENGGTNFILGDTITSDISFADTLWGFDFFGTETSPIIGPAADWNTLYWKLDSLEGPTDDSIRIHLYGVEYSGNKTLLMDTLVSPLDSIENLYSIIDPVTYPFMQLSAFKWDKTGFTPAQLDSWHVLYEDVPEAALDGTSGVVFIPSDTLYEGQDMAVAFDIKNISDLPLDSLLINYWIEDPDHNLVPISYPRQDSLRVGQTFRDTIHFENTVSLDGINSIWVEVNPYVAPNQTDQLEKYHFNNLGQIPFFVAADDENPILDVTFNGYHILNGDIIDPASEVIITLKDDNPFLLMDEEADTANFGIYLTNPNGDQKRLSFRNSLGEPLMEWIPADASSRKFKIIYQGDFDTDGMYRLLVQGVDNAGNVSGDFEYDIEFEIDHNSSITNLMNYPNPFTTSTQFVFTLTGSEVPDEFTIQIMNVSGTVVREITRDELGDIHIGRNITEFAWDGTDEFGDQLARGVYLYRVIVKLNGEQIDHRDSGADQYFTKSFGKMYKL